MMPLLYKVFQSRATKHSPEATVGQTTAITRLISRMICQTQKPSP